MLASVIDSINVFAGIPVPVISAPTCKTAVASTSTELTVSEPVEIAPKNEVEETPVSYFK